MFAPLSPLQQQQQRIKDVLNKELFYLSEA
jgi:hypothetical protein